MGAAGSQPLTALSVDCQPGLQGHGVPVLLGANGVQRACVFDAWGVIQGW